MLGLMRKNANSWVIGALFAVIIFVFALNFGPWAGNVGGSQQYAADVNGRIITLPEFQLAYLQQVRVMQSYQPDFTEEKAAKQGFKGIVLEQLVAKELLSELARKNGLAVSDKELAAYIKSSLFGSDTPYSKETYRRLVYGNFRTTEAQFESQVRRELLAERMAKLLRTGAQVSASEIIETYKNNSLQVSVNYLKIDPKQVHVKQKMSLKDAKAWAEKHPEEVAHYYNLNINEFRIKKSAKKGKDSGKKDSPDHEPLEKVQTKVAQKIFLQNEQRKAAQKLAKSLLAKVESGSSMEKAKLQVPTLSKKAVKVDRTTKFGASSYFVPGIGVNESLKTAAMQLTKKDPVAKKVFEVNDQYVLIQLAKRDEADMKKFEKQKDQLTEGLLVFKQRKLMQNYIEYLQKNSNITYNEALKQT